MDAKAYSPFGPQELVPRPTNDNRPLTSMVERVARALAFVDGHGDFLPGSEAKGWYEPARAAIEAMRWPTERMLYAGEEWCAVRTIYRAMIDKALAEHDERRAA